VAESAGSPAGAAWARQFTTAEQPAFYVDANTPEVSIGVRVLMMRSCRGKPSRRGVVPECARHQPCLRLYERAGFRCVPGSEFRNRCGGLSLGMMLSGTE
jgi:hypothetical protein